MTNRHVQRLIVLLAAACGASAWAEDGKIPTSTLLTGDTIILRTTTEGFKPTLSTDKAKIKAHAASAAASAAAAAAAASAPPAAVAAAESAAQAAASAAAATAPARTKFRVLSDTGATTDRKLSLEVKDVPCNSNGDVHIASLVSQQISGIRVNDKDCKIAEKVEEGHRYEITKDELDNAGYRRLGFIYGGVVIPYKYFRHDKSFEPAPALGPFLGYRMGHQRHCHLCGVDDQDHGQGQDQPGRCRHRAFGHRCVQGPWFHV